MLALGLAAAFLLVSHFGLSSSGARPWLVARLGEGRFLGLYSLVALAAFVWLGWAYARAPYVELWPAAAWQAWVPLLAMPIALILLVGGLTTPNPTVVGQGAELEVAEPATGVLRITRHPVMWGFGLLGLAHLVPNGQLAALVLFGTITLLALLGTRMIDAKYAVRWAERWPTFAAVTSNLPFAAILAGRQRFAPAEIGWWRLGLTFVIYGLLLAIHPWLFGVSAFGAI